MRWIVILPNPREFSLEDLKFSLKINPDLADNVVLLESKRKVRIYQGGGYEEYEIRNIIKLGEEAYYILGKLLACKKNDYKTAVKNATLVEV